MNIQKEIKKKGILLKKKWGQNFFIGDPDKLLDLTSITKKDFVIEVGTGVGNITEKIARRCKFVISYEIDERLKEMIYKNLEGVKNVEVRFMDFLKEKEFPGDDLIFFSNLPYSSGTEILKKVAKINNITRGYFMIQKELGERIKSHPSRKTYSAISVFLQTFFSFRKLKSVSKENFFPVPQVDSTFFEFKRIRKWEDKWSRYETFLKRVFSKRRKKIKTSIFSFIKELPEFNMDLRPENLSVEEYIKLYEIFSQSENKPNS